MLGTVLGEVKMSLRVASKASVKVMDTRWLLRIFDGGAGERYEREQMRLGKGMRRG